MINIDLNSYGKTIGDTSFIENICKEHKECIECPVMERGAIKRAGDGKIYSCSTAIIRNIQKNNGKV